MLRVLGTHHSFSHVVRSVSRKGGNWGDPSGADRTLPFAGYRLTDQHGRSSTARTICQPVRTIQNSKIHKQIDLGNIFWVLRIQIKQKQKVKPLFKKLTKCFGISGVCFASHQTRDIKVSFISQITEYEYSIIVQFFFKSGQSQFSSGEMLRTPCWIQVDRPTWPVFLNFWTTFFLTIQPYFQYPDKINNDILSAHVHTSHHLNTCLIFIVSRLSYLEMDPRLSLSF